MINNNRLQLEIATVLRTIGNKKCLEKAERLENESSSMSVFNLRDLELKSSNVTAIASCLKQEGNQQPLKSISFSYNPLLGDAGAVALAKNLPKSVCEIGLVGCGIGDIGGIEILHWMKNAPKLQMICMEQNSFSEKLRFEFKKFRADNPYVLVVF
ncbi:MAG: hypothetical protein AB8B69_26775 [Chitinophagales bacterium]